MALNIQDTLKQYESELGGEQPSGGLEDTLKQYESEMAPPPEASAKDTLRDYNISFRKGLLGVPQTAVGLADIVTKGKAGKAVKESGLDFEKMQEKLASGYSPSAKEASEHVQKADGFLPTVKAIAERPSVAGHTIVESIPAMAGGQLIAGGIMKAAPKVASRLAGAIGEGAVTSGQLAEQVRSKSKTGELTLPQIAAIVGTGGVTGLVSNKFGKMSEARGVANLDTALLGRTAAEAAAARTAAARAAANKNFVQRGLEAGAIEGAQETIQSGSENIGANIAQGEDDIFKGTGSASAMGLVAGAGMGAPVGALSKGGHGGAVPPPVSNAAEDPGSPNQSDMAEEDLPVEPEGEGAINTTEPTELTEEDLANRAPINFNSEGDIYGQEDIPEPGEDTDYTAMNAYLDQIEKEKEGGGPSVEPEDTPKAIPDWVMRDAIQHEADMAFEEGDGEDIAPPAPAPKTPEQIKREASDLAAAPIIEQLSNAPDGVFNRSTMAALANGATQPQIDAEASAQALIDQQEAPEQPQGGQDAQTIPGDTGLANVPGETEKGSPADSGGDLRQAQQGPQPGSETAVEGQGDQQQQQPAPPLPQQETINGEAENQTEETGSPQEAGQVGVDVQGLPQQLQPPLEEETPAVKQEVAKVKKVLKSSSTPGWRNEALQSRVINGKEAKLQRPKIVNTRTGDVNTGITRVESPEDALHVVAPFRKNAQEQMLAVVLDRNNDVIQVVKHTTGTSDSAMVDAGILAGSIHGIPGAASVYFAHNHPSGQPEQSQADYRTTEALADLMRDTGIESRGMLVTVAGRSGSYYDASTPGQSRPISPTVAPRRQTVPVTERAIARHSKAQEAPVTGTSSAVNAINALSEGRTGLLLTDNQHVPVSFVAMSIPDLRKLRAGRGRGASLLLQELHETNARAAILNIGNEDYGSMSSVGVDLVLSNVASFLSNTQNTRFLDTIAGGQSLTSQNIVPKATKHFFSIRSAKSTMPESDIKSVERRSGIVKRAGDVGARARIFSSRRAKDSQSVPGLKRELNTNHVTGIPNKRAFLSKPIPPFMASVDVDSLKFVNDNLGEGHVSGDKLLKAVAQVLSNHADAYHVSGDEILVRGNSREELVKALDAANAELSSGRHTITSPTGSFSKPSFSYGISETNQAEGVDKKEVLEQALIQADLEMVQNKKDREAAGLRAGRGERPQGFEGGVEPVEATPVENTFESEQEAIEYAVSILGKGIYRLVSLGLLNFTIGKSTWSKWARQAYLAEAVYDNEQKKAYLDLQSISRDRLIQVILHELGEHFNLKRMLGEKGYKSLQDQIASQAKIPGSFAQRIWREVATTPGYSNLEVGSEAFISEVVAKMGEESPNTPFYRRLLSKIKSFLIERGLGSGFLTGTLTENDLHDLLRASLRSASRADIKEIRSTYYGNTVSHSISPTVNVDGVARPTTDSSGKVIHPTTEGVVNFWKWFGDSKVVDYQGRPLNLNHGTTADFTEFRREYSNPESDLGSGFYLSNNPEDTETNYSGEGPDLKSKIDRLAERIQSQSEQSGEDMPYEDAVSEARDRFMRHEGVSVPTYVRMENPVVIGGNDQTVFTFEEGYDPGTDEYDGEMSGTVLDILDAVKTVSEFGDIHGVDSGAVNAAIMNRAMDEGSIDAETLIKIIKDEAQYSYMESEDGDNFGGSEFARRVFEEAGYDGFIDNTVSDKFDTMKGLDEDTTHYVAFDSGQIKSSIGNTGAFSKGSKDIRYSIPGSGLVSNIANKSRARMSDVSRTSLATLTVRQMIEVSRKYLPILGRYEEHMQRRAKEKDSRLRTADRTLTKWKSLGEDDVKKVSRVINYSSLYDVSSAIEWAGVTALSNGTFEAYSQTSFSPDRMAALQDRAKKSPFFVSGNKAKAVFSNKTHAEHFVRLLQDSDLQQTAFRNGSNPQGTVYQDANRARKKAHPELRKAYLALPDKGKQVYSETYEQHTAIFEARVAALEERISENVLDGKTRAAMIADMRAQFESRSLNWYYAPLKRFGNHWLHGKDSRGRVWFKTYESDTERDKAVTEFESQGGSEVRIGTSLTGVTGVGGLSDGMSDTFIRSVNDMVANHVQGDVGENLKNDIYQFYLSTLPDVSIRHNSMSRQGVLGFEEDGMKVFASAMHHGASQLANMTEGRKMQQVIEDAKVVHQLASSPNKVSARNIETEAARRLLQQWDTYGEQGIIEAELNKTGLSDEDKKLFENMLRLRDKVSRAAAALAAGTPSATTPVVTPTLADVQEPLNRIVTKNEMLVNESKKITDEYKAKTAYVIDELEKSYLDMVSTGSSEIDRISAVLRQVSFLWTLGYGLSSGIVNMAQTGVVAVPVMNAKYDPIKVADGLRRVTSELVLSGKLGITRDANGNYSNRDADNNMSITVVLNKRLRALQQSGGSPQGIQTLIDEIQLLETLKEDGTISRTQSHDVIGIGQEGETHGGALHSLAKTAGWIFHHTERANRESTALMAYRLARKGNPGTNTAPMSHDEAIEYGRYVNNKAHGDYTNENAARILRGPIAGVALQYKKYTQMMMYLWTTSTIDALNGWQKLPDGTPEQKQAKEAAKQEAKESRRTLLSLVVAQISVAGVSGLPMMGAMMWVVNGLASLAFGDDDEELDLEEELRIGLTSMFNETVATAVSKGFINAFTPVNVASRLSLRDVVVRESLVDREGRDEAMELLSQLLGPTGGLFIKLLEAASMAGDGNLYRALETASPKVIADPLKGARFLYEGARDMKGDLVKGMSAMEALAQSVGFGSSSLEVRYTERGYAKGAANMLGGVRTKLVSNYARAALKGEDLTKQAKLIEGWNSRHPEWPIGYKNIQASARKIHANEIAKGGRGYSVNPKLAYLYEQKRISDEEPE